MEKTFLIEDKNIKITGSMLLTIPYRTDKFSLLKVYSLSGAKYLYAIDVVDVAKLLGVSLKSLRTSLYGSRWNKYFPRKYKKKHDYAWFDDNINIIENLKYRNIFELQKIRALTSLESLLDIINIYSLSFMSGEISAKNIHIGQRCSELAKSTCIMNLKEILRELIKSAKYALEVQTFYSLRNDKPFESCNDLLNKTLFKVYPDRETWKYNALRCTIFTYAYEDVMGVEAFNKLKEMRHPFDTVCSGITSLRTQKRLAAYITSYTAALEIFHEMNLFQDTKNRNTYTKQVRMFVQKFFKKEQC